VALDVHAENLSGGRSCLVGRPGDLDATGLAASADLDLSLDDNHAATAGADFHCRCAGFFNGLGDDASQYRHAVRFEHVACLVLEQIHEFILIVAEWERLSEILECGRARRCFGVPLVRLISLLSNRSGRPQWSTENPVSRPRPQPA